MGQRPLSDELIDEAVRLYDEHNRRGRRAAKYATDQYTGAKGIPERTFANRLKVAAKRGKLGYRPVLPGFQIKQTSTELDENGDLKREWIKQHPEAGPEFEMPAGHVIKGVSAYVDQAGNVRSQWIKTREDQVDIEAAIKATFDDYNGRSILSLPPTHVDADLATFYNIADHHLGMYSWAKETGEDYDLKIAEDLLLDSMGKLVSMTPASETAVVLNLGDFFHTDNTTNRTPLHGFQLDVDTRYPKVLQLGVKLNIACIELALQKHKHVTVRMLGGNHDPHSSYALSVALAAFFSNNERVNIDCSPSKFFHWRFGKVFVTATHGDTVKPDDMPGIMASRWPEDWGESKFRYAYLGHFHHKEKGGGEGAGVVWEVFQTLAAKDAFHAYRKYTSGRSMVSITHHRERGEISRNIQSV